VACATLAASVARSRAAVLRMSERRRCFLCERRRSRRILDVRAADLQEKMAEQRFSVPSASAEDGGIQRTSQRAERAIKHARLREQLKKNGPV
jgi:hypothetical protein